jgi:hypothetical protein
LFHIGRLIFGVRRVFFYSEVAKKKKIKGVF